AFKPLNWINPPCKLREETVADGPDIWAVTHSRSGEKLVLPIEEIMHDSSHELGKDPGLQKDGVESHLQELLAEHITTLGEGYTLVRREYSKAIGPVDLLCRDYHSATVAAQPMMRYDIIRGELA